MRKVFNFGAGPAMLPEEVLLQAQNELLDWQGTGMSIMEFGHRLPEFQHIVDESTALLRELMNIPNNYQVLFLAGGATAQFSMIPLNFLAAGQTADYFNTGIWSQKALAEAARFGKVHEVTQLSKENGVFKIPPANTWALTKSACYVHYTPNETIQGVAFHQIPEVGSVPLIADMTSMILSEKIDVTRFGLIYAGAQKNLGQAGITAVIIRDDMVIDAPPRTPILYSYKINAENKSCYNTPPTFAWYILNLVLKWTKRQGGVEYFETLNARKAKKLYQFLDAEKDFYCNNVDNSCRSKMNIPFQLVKADLTQEFLNLANQAGLTMLKGHRLAGGVRASIYNAMPEAGVDALIEFMKTFKAQFG